MTFENMYCRRRGHCRAYIMSQEEYGCICHMKIWISMCMLHLNMTDFWEYLLPSGGALSRARCAAAVSSASCCSWDLAAVRVRVGGRGGAFAKGSCCAFIMRCVCWLYVVWALAVHSWCAVGTYCVLCACNVWCVCWWCVLCVQYVLCVFIIFHQYSWCVVCVYYAVCVCVCMCVCVCVCMMCYVRLWCGMCVHDVLRVFIVCSVCSVCVVCISLCIICIHDVFTMSCVGFVHW